MSGWPRGVSGDAHGMTDDRVFQQPRSKRVTAVRATTVFNKLLRLPGTSVTAVVFEPGGVVVDVRLRRRHVVCPHCGWSTPFRHNLQREMSSWRALDLGVWAVTIRAYLRRLSCPTHGVVVEGVPFARHKARFIRDFEGLVAWCATKMGKSAVARSISRACALSLLRSAVMLTSFSRARSSCLRSRWVVGRRPHPVEVGAECQDRGAFVGGQGLWPGGFAAGQLGLSLGQFAQGVFPVGL